MSKFRFSKASLEALAGVHPILRQFCYELLKYHDFKVISGVRSVHEQNSRVASGVSQTLNSRHLVQPDGWGHAVDLWPIVNGKFMEPEDNEEHLRQWYYFGGLGSMLGGEYTVTWGGDWNFNDNILDNDFDDLYHWQINV